MERRQPRGLRMSQEARSRLLKDYHALPRIPSPISKQWENWLKGAAPHLPITFDSKEAVESESTVFITPLHPMARQAARFMESGMANPICVVRATDAEITPGRYPFVIYEWRYSGVRDDLVLYPIAESQEVSRRLADLLEYGRPGNLPDDQIPDQRVFDALDAVHYERWAGARSDHFKRNKQTANYRQESLNTSHHARVAILEDRLSNATNEKIRRMRQAQLSHAEADYQRRSAELKEAVHRADLNAEPVAYGVVIVTWVQTDG